MLRQKACLLYAGLIGGWLLMLMSLTATPVQAASLTVTTNDAQPVPGDGLCSLSEAIINANNDNQSGSTDCPAGSGPDSINLDNRTIQVGATSIGACTFNHANLPEVTSYITIRNGTLDGVNSTQNFMLCVNSGDSLTLDNVTIRRAGDLTSPSTGRASGAVYSYGGTVMVQNSTITETLGVAINNEYGQLTVENSSLTNNANGAILADGSQSSTLIRSSRISGNDTTEPYWNVIYGNEGDLTITGSLITGNRSTRRTIFHRENLVIVNSTIAANNAIASSVVYSEGTLNMKNTIVWGNSNGVAGLSATGTTVDFSLLEATYYYAQFTGNNTVFQSPYFVDLPDYNTAPTTAGDFRLQPVSHAIDAGSNTAAGLYGVHLTDMNASPRYADDSGILDRGEGTSPIIDMGAYEFQGTSCTAYAFPYTIDGTPDDLFRAMRCAENNTTADTIDLDGHTMSRNQPYSDFDSSTGFPRINSEITLQNGTLENTSSAILRLLFVSFNGHLTLDNMTLLNGSAYESGEYNGYGGGVHSQGSLVVRNSTFEDSYARLGSAIYSYGSLEVTNSTFRNNYAYQSGGAIFYEGIGVQEPLLISGSLFENNRADEQATVYIKESPSSSPDRVETSIFRGNTTRIGGALILLSPDTVLTDLLIENNQSELAGAIYAVGASPTDGSLVIRNSILRGNTASAEAGAIDVRIGKTTIINSLITGNTANTISAIKVSRGILNLTNTTISGNTATGDYTLYNGDDSGTATPQTRINNSILWGNSAPEIAVITGSVAINYSLVDGWSGGTGNITSGYTVNDIFAAPGPGGDYRLADSSPAIDSANNTAANNARIGSDDLAGDPRFRDTASVPDTGAGSAPIIDMGAYEYPPLPYDVDLNNDGIVSPTDAVYVVNRLGTTDMSADVNGDNQVNNSDLQAVLDVLGVAP